MPSREVIFTVKLPIKSVWSFMTDRREVGCLFPGCKGVKILNDLTPSGRSNVLGPFSRLIEMHAHTTELVEQQRMAWTATHEHLITGSCHLPRDFKR
jgi:carbon monoxide dehydrogenase subunit G